MTKYIFAILLLTASCTTTEHITSKENYLRKAIIDKTNHKQENLQFLCYNCYYLTVGNPLGGRPKKDHF